MICRCTLPSLPPASGSWNRCPRIRSGVPERHAGDVVAPDALVEAAYGVAAADLLPIITQGAQRRQVSTGECLSEEDLTNEQTGSAPVPE